MRIHDHVLRCHIARAPLLRTRRAVHQIIVVFEQHLEIAHVPRRRVRLPRALNAAGRGMPTVPCAKGVTPPQTHLVNRRPFGFRPDQRHIARAMRLAKGMATRHQGHGFLIVHRHARKGFTNITPRPHRVCHPVRAFRVHINQPHLHCGQRGLQLTVAGIPLVVQPDILIAPIDVFLWLPHIRAAPAETKGFEPH